MSWDRTTSPGVDTPEPFVSPEVPALVIAHSSSRPHRVGQVAFPPFCERAYVGRGDLESEKFLHFVPQRPGQSMAVDPRENVLEGATISRRQLTVRWNGDSVEIENVGRCPTYVNGEERSNATIQPGDTVRLGDELVLLCVLRSRALVANPHVQLDVPAFGDPDADRIVGESPVAWQLRESLALVARDRVHVFVEGESGTGKKLAAAAIHRQSRFAHGPFVACTSASFIADDSSSFRFFGNIANYPEFGLPERPGLVGSADGGTLFLDEIGGFIDAQVSLMRVLDGGDYHPVGDSLGKRADLRVIAATTRDKDDEEAFRLSFVARFPARVRIPPLRERREDIPLLLRHLLLQSARRSPEIGERFFRHGPNGRPEPRFSARLVDFLVRHPLPLNMRDLERILLGALRVSPGDEVRLPTGD